MRFTLVISLALHASLVVVTVYGLPHLKELPPPAEESIVVELVEIADVTTPQLPELQAIDEAKPRDLSETVPEAAKEAEQVEAPRPATAPPPPPEIKVALAVPAAPAPPLEAKPSPPKSLPVPAAPAPPVEAKPAPPPPKPLPAPSARPREVKPAPPSPPEARPAPVEAAKPPEAKPATPPPKPIEGQAVARAPVPKPKPRERPKKDFKRTMSRVAALLDKSREDEPETSRRAERAKAPKGRPEASKSPLARGQATPLDQRMTMREIDAIKWQIERCWTIPAGARDAAKLVVQIRIQLNRDGSLARAPEILDGYALRSRGGFYRAAVDSARRAVLKCSPLRNLPVEKFDRWRDITLSFDPREMLAR